MIGNRLYCDNCCLLLILFSSFKKYFPKYSVSFALRATEYHSTPPSFGQNLLHSLFLLLSMLFPVCLGFPASFLGISSQRPLVLFSLLWRQLWQGSYCSEVFKAGMEIIVSCFTSELFLNQVRLSSLRLGALLLTVLDSNIEVTSI